MKILYIILSVFALVLLISSCGSTSKIEALKPEPSNNKPLVFSNKPSVINMPLEISLQEIETQLNKNLKGLIFNDSILDDDKMELKVWKTADIKLQEKNNVIVSEIPLKIWGKYKYGTEFLGLNDTKEFNLNGIITLNSKTNFVNFKLNTTSEIEDIKWTESPSVVIAGKNVPITYLINPALSVFKKKIATKIDEAIDKNCDFKKQVDVVLEKLSEPFLTSEAYEAWFKLVPTEVYNTPAEIKNKKVVFNLGLQCNMQTFVGQKPKNSFVKNKILIKAVTKIPTDFKVSVAAISTYENASTIITKNFAGKEFGSGNKKVTVQKVAIWQKEAKMIVALDLLGSINGTIYLSGIPKYNQEKKEIYFEDLDYVLNSKGLLTKTANWLLHGIILNKIKENCKYSITPNLEEGKKNLLPYFNNYSPMKGVFVNGKLNAFDFDTIEITDKAIIAFVTSTGQLSVKIDGFE